MSARLVHLRRLAVGLQALGFLLVGVVIWLDEYLDLPRWLFHAQPTPFRPEESAFETALLAIVALASLAVTTSLFRRWAQAQFSAAFCISCQRIRNGDEWTTLSEVLQSDQGDALVYGLCPSCTPTALSPPFRSESAAAQLTR
jgi:hypothetical protein